MKKVYKIKPANDNAIQYLADNLREIDKDEAKIAYPDLSIFDAIKQSASAAKFCGVLYGEDDVPILITGINPGPGNIGIAWMVATNAISTIPRKFFMTESKKILEMYHQWFPILGNVVSAHNVTSIKWLTKLGCVFTDDLNVNGMPCKRFISYQPQDTTQYDYSSSYNFYGANIVNMDIGQYVPQGGM